ncbi:MAG: PTS IIA-like nitrogen regulatory protein PtsN [Candidatus Pelagadaptatus aseana]|uniref:PTS sugar transporter subunit IIA n=1 Tax=Candidatus Pelagadaptatus aseana TaxID=3120508 RepID=UPI0039B2B75C
MEIKTFLNSRRTLCGVEGISKKRTIEILANLIAEDIPSLSADDIFLSFIAREKLGSTGLGQGIAIPHCRISNCIGTVGALIKLDKPIDFEAIDGKPVDLVFALIAPEEADDSHLQTLSALAEKLIESEYTNKLRQSETNEALYLAATSQQDSAVNT